MSNQIATGLQTIHRWIETAASGPADGPGSETYALKIRSQKLALAANAATIDENMAECRQALAALDRALQAITDADKKIGTIVTAITIIAEALDAAEKALRMAGAI